MVTKRKIVSFIFTLFISISPALALAQGLVTIVPENCRGVNAAEKCGVCDIAKLAQNIITDGIFIAILLSAFLFAWAGWKYLTAQGNENNVKDAKGIFANIFKGILLIIGAWLLVDTLMNTLTGSNGNFGLWNSIC